MIRQFECTVGPLPRGFHLITDQVLRCAGDLPEAGILHVFIQHTSAALAVNENADPDVLHDFELYFNKLAPEHVVGMRHTLEGPDDMPSHIKSVLAGASVSIPITKHRLNLGTWQGIYLCEFRNRPRPRRLIITVYS